MKVLLENMLSFEDGKTVTKEDIQAFAAWLKNKTSDREVPFRPARVLEALKAANASVSGQ